MEVKHTPGPWIEKEWTECLTIFPHKGNEDEPGYPLATVHKDPKHGFTADRARANARLIAAAPDLLAALENLLNPIEKGWKVDDMTVRIEEARAAIAKARGDA
jgi:hypothetical protein